MKFFFYIPGMAADGHVMENLSLGGSESAGMYMSRELVRRGHKVVAFTNGQPGNWHGVEIAPIGQPSEQFPAGENFDRRATTEPHDVLIAQRTPAPFLRPKNCRQAYMSMHDLARVRNRSQIKGSLWNCDGILAVSDWHKNQIEKVYDLPGEFVHTIRNGIDLSLFNKEPDYERKFRGKKLVYQSRPERGLRHLVEEDGIMEQLFKIDRDITLVVCGYDNTTPEMEGHYRQLWQRCYELPNVELVGNLNKRTLAELLRDAALLVYPVVPIAEHEETSCISIMEAQAAGTPVITMNNGAVMETAFFPEVINNQVDPVFLLDYADDGSTPIDRFVSQISALMKGEKLWRPEAELAFERATAYDWSKPAEALEELVGCASHEQTSNALRLAKHFAYNSDRRALIKMEQQDCVYPAVKNLIDGAKYADHGEKEVNAFYLCENIQALKKGDLPQIENIHDIPTTNMVIQVLDRVYLRGPFKLLDYGCRTGVLTALLALRYPDCTFTGADLSPEAIAEANKQDVNNLEFVVADHPTVLQDKFDVVLCMETLEHVLDPAAMANGLEELLKPLGTMLLTFPMGPSEASSHLSGNNEPYEHINHLEWQDVQDMWGHKDSFSQNFFAWGGSAPNGASIGGQVVTWQRDNGLDGSKAINWDRKMVEQAPRETLSVCMIVKQGASTLERTIKSLVNVADEIVIGVDGDLDNWPILDSAPSLHNWACPEIFSLSASPLEQGFDAARNETLERASCDWVLWIDSDEELVYPERILKYLRPNCYEAYAIPHHHLTAEPAGLLKTDYPTRLFRQSNGYQFFGMVHEHPSVAPDVIPKHVMVLGENIGISHTGYLSEEVRRNRFGRNWPLMQRDREKYPQRVLGEFLFLRDLLHVAKFEMERNNNQITHKVREYAEQGLAIFDRLIELDELRFVLESLPYVGEAARILKGNDVVVMQLAVGTRHVIADQSLKQIIPERLEGVFADSETAKRVSSLLINDQFKPYEEKYL